MSAKKKSVTVSAEETMPRMGSGRHEVLEQVQIPKGVWVFSLAVLARPVGQQGMQVLLSSPKHRNPDLFEDDIMREHDELCVRVKAGEFQFPHQY